MNRHTGDAVIAEDGIVLEAKIAQGVVLVQGEASAGEGVLGLRGGFIQAGAQNLLMTLWPVSDKWTVDLMKGFYDKAMRTGNAPGVLADVQREYLVKLKEEKNLVFAARLAGPFVMDFQGEP